VVGALLLARSRAKAKQINANQFSVLLATSINKTQSGGSKEHDSATQVFTLRARRSAQQCSPQTRYFPCYLTSIAFARIIGFSVPLQILASQSPFNNAQPTSTLLLQSQLHHVIKIHLTYCSPIFSGPSPTLLAVSLLVARIHRS
jgi:hypothetical protein